MQDSIAEAVDRQKKNADKNERANILSFNGGDLVLLSTVNLRQHIVTNVGSNKLLPKFIGPFRVLRRIGNAYTIKLPRKMRAHPTFYFGRLRPYHQYGTSSGEEIPCARASPNDTISPSLKLGYLPAKPRDILTSFPHLVANRTLYPLILKLFKTNAVLSFY